MRKILTCVCMCIGLFTAPAHATGEFFCTADGGVEVDLSIGRLDVLHILNATISVGHKVWSTIEGDGVVPIAVGQAFGDSDHTNVDFVDKNFESVIAKLRVQHISEDEKWAAGGVFSIKGEGAWVVKCEG